MKVQGNDTITDERLEENEIPADLEEAILQRKKELHAVLLQIHAR